MSGPILISLMGFYLTHVLYRDDTRHPMGRVVTCTNYTSVEREWSDNVYFRVRSKSPELMKKNGQREYGIAQKDRVECNLFY
jgi:hypothetical protein